MQACNPLKLKLNGGKWNVKKHKKIQAVSTLYMKYFITAVKHMFDRSKKQNSTKPKIAITYY